MICLIYTVYVIWCVLGTCPGTRTINNNYSIYYKRFSTSAPLGALVLLVASDVVSNYVVPLLMSNSGATSKWNYDGFRYPN